MVAIVSMLSNCVMVKIVNACFVRLFSLQKVHRSVPRNGLEVSEI